VQLDRASGKAQQYQHHTKHVRDECQCASPRGLLSRERAASLTRSDSYDGRDGMKRRRTAEAKCRAATESMTILARLVTLPFAAGSAVFRGSASR
jgi:hypothetical protein